MEIEIYHLPVIQKRRYSSDCPNNDPMFMEIVKHMERCEESNGWACDCCLVENECRHLLSVASTKSSKYTLDKQEVQRYIGEFKRLKETLF